MVDFIGRERDREMSEFFVVPRKQYEVQVMKVLSGDGGEGGVGEHLGQFDFALASSAAEDDAVAILYPSVRAAHQSGHVVVVQAIGIRFS